MMMMIIIIKVAMITTINTKVENKITVNFSLSMPRCIRGGVEVCSTHS